MTLLSTTGGRYSLSLTRSSGLFKGTFTHTSGSVLNYFGAVYQKGSTSEVGGFGYFLTELSKVKDYTGQSGSVLLRAQ